MDFMLKNTAIYGIFMDFTPENAARISWILCLEALQFMGFSCGIVLDFMPENAAISGIFMDFMLLLKTLEFLEFSWILWKFSGSKPVQFPARPQLRHRALQCVAGAQKQLFFLCWETAPRSLPLLVFSFCFSFDFRELFRRMCEENVPSLTPQPLTFDVPYMPLLYAAVGALVHDLLLHQDFGGQSRFACEVLACRTLQELETMCLRILRTLIRLTVMSSPALRNALSASTLTIGDDNGWGLHPKPNPEPSDPNNLEDF